MIQTVQYYNTKYAMELKIMLYYGKAMDLGKIKKNIF